MSRCRVCDAPDHDRATIFRGEPYCCDNCRKILKGERPSSQSFEGTKDWAAMWQSHSVGQSDGKEITTVSVETTPAGPTCGIKPGKFLKKPFYVDGIQVTEENMAAVATWCNGEIQHAVINQAPTPSPYIRVGVYRPLNDRQTQAFVGDWVLYAGTGFKVYTNRAFEASFEPVNEEACQSVPETS